MVWKFLRGRFARGVFNPGSRKEKNAIGKKFDVVFTTKHIDYVGDPLPFPPFPFLAWAQGAPLLGPGRAMAGVGAGDGRASGGRGGSKGRRSMFGCVDVTC